jgi:hypothetical protein
MILVSFSLLTLTTGAVTFMHGYFLGGYILTLGFFITTYGMALWLRDIITEATKYKYFNYILNLNNRVLFFFFYLF